MPSVHSKPIGHPLRGFDIKKAHDSLLKNHYGLEPSTGLPSDPNKSTKVHNAFDASQDLHEAAARIKDIKELCGDALDTLNNIKSGSKKRSRETTKFIVDTIFPALDVAADIVNAGAKRASPISKSQYAHDVGD